MFSITLTLNYLLWSDSWGFRNIAITQLFLNPKPIYVHKKNLLLYVFSQPGRLIYPTILKRAFWYQKRASKLNYCPLILLYSFCFNHLLWSDPGVSITYFGPTLGFLTLGFLNICFNHLLWSDPGAFVVITLTLLFQLKIVQLGKTH